MLMHKDLNRKIKYKLTVTQMGGVKMVKSCWVLLIWAEKHDICRYSIEKCPIWVVNGVVDRH